MKNSLPIFLRCVSGISKQTSFFRLLKMMVVRGITEVAGTPLTAGASAAISGIAGIGHILVGVGIILLICSLKKTANKQE